MWLAPSRHSLPSQGPLLLAICRRGPDAGARGRTRHRSTGSFANDRHNGRVGRSQSIPHGLETYRRRKKAGFKWGGGS